MNKVEIAQILAIAGAFDNRNVQPATVEAWALIPAIQHMDHRDALDAVIAHQTGEKKGEYLTVGHVVDYVAKTTRSVDIEADVRSAKARGLIDKSWPKNNPLPPDVANKLRDLRQAERVAAVHELTVDAAVDYGLVLKDEPVVVGDRYRDRKDLDL